MYDSINDPYTYTGTDILKNKAGLRDQSILDQFELSLFTIRATESLPTGNFDLAHYVAIHHHLFQDVYAWAGEFRTVPIRKGTSLFCYPEYIQTSLDSAFSELEGIYNLLDADHDSFIRTITELLSELNSIHPFRDGNGRTQLIFVGMLCLAHGYHFDIDNIDKELFMSAIIQSFHGDTIELHRILTSLILHSHDTH